MLVKKQMENLRANKTKDYYYASILPNILYNFNVSSMNVSGIRIREIIKNNNVKFLIILYDDIRVKFSDYKIVFGESHRGHNGIKSIMENCAPILFEQDFYRVRIGVGPKPSNMELGNYVLSKVTEDKEKLIMQQFGKIWLDIYTLCKEKMMI
jgi:peptidyl-tRNA hydrolase